MKFWHSHGIDRKKNFLLSLSQAAFHFWAGYLTSPYFCFPYLKWEIMTGDKLTGMLLHNSELLGWKALLKYRIRSGIALFLCQMLFTICLAKHYREIIPQLPFLLKTSLKQREKETGSKYSSINSASFPISSLWFPEILDSDFLFMDFLNHKRSCCI